MADSTNSNINLSTESIQAATEDTREVQITNQAAAEDGSTFMDPKLYKAAADGHIHVFEQYNIHVQRTPKRTQFSMLQPNLVKRTALSGSFSCLLHHYCNSPMRKVILHFTLQPGKGI